MKKLLFALVLASLSTGIWAAEKRPETPFALGLFTPIELPGANWNVVGLRIDLLFGRHEKASGLQIGGLCNVIDREMDGLQIGFFNQANTLAGLQIGVVNIVEDGSQGLQIGALNVMKDSRFPAMPLVNFGF